MRGRLQTVNELYFITQLHWPLLPEVMKAPS